VALEWKHEGDPPAWGCGEGVGMAIEADRVFVPDDGKHRGTVLMVKGAETLQNHIASALRQMTEVGGGHNFIILETGEKKNLYVQFATSCGSAVILGEAVSDRYLRAPLSREQSAELRRLGWRPPTRRKWPNYFRLWTVLNDAHRRAIANIALETLEQVYGWRREDPLQITTHLDW
jgi:hypothetical protein